MKITTDLPEEINKALKIHKLRYNFITLQDALVNALEKFFESEDFDYFEKLNIKEKKIPKPKKDYKKLL